jgi:hypothetical protein
VGEQIRDEFRETVEDSSSGVAAFWSRLYQFSQMVCASHFDDYVKLYECYGEVTPHYVSLLMRVALHTSNLSERFKDESPLVFGRQSIELLFQAARSSLPIRQRCVAAELLVALAIDDDVSIMEVQVLLNAIIDDPCSQQLLDRHHRHTRAEQMLKALLHCLSVSRKTDGRFTYSSDTGIDMSNEYVNNQFPGAIFEKSQSEHLRPAHRARMTTLASGKNSIH